MTDKYKFNEFSTTNIKSDPIFNSESFQLFGDPMRGFNVPLLFIVGAYRYILINPEDFKQNKKLCFKVATYLYHHETSNSDGRNYTYFFGNINECKEIGQEFTNQICKYVSYEMVEEWYPKTLTEANDYIINYFLSKQMYYGQEFMLSNYDLHYLFFVSYELKAEEFEKSLNFILYHLEECY